MRGIHNSPVTGEFSSQRPMTRIFDVFYPHLNKRFSKQSRRRWLETQSRSLWRRCNEMEAQNRACVVINCLTQAEPSLMSTAGYYAPCHYYHFFLGSIQRDPLPCMRRYQMYTLRWTLPSLVRHFPYACAYELLNWQCPSMAVLNRFLNYIKMSSYQYMDPHFKDKTVSRQSYL